jgi:hypothetical protein
MSAYWIDLESELNMEFSDDDIKIFLDIISRLEINVNGLEIQRYLYTMQYQ